MNFYLCTVLFVLLMPRVVASQALLCKEASLSCPVITQSSPPFKASRLKHFTLQAWYPVVYHVRETLDAFQQISENFENQGNL